MVMHSYTISWSSSELANEIQMFPSTWMVNCPRQNAGTIRHSGEMNLIQTLINTTYHFIVTHTSDKYTHMGEIEKLSTNPPETRQIALFFL
jgi:hypothetical protein